eukprot:1410581-Pyramimonas_sp.AAC.1
MDDVGVASSDIVRTVEKVLKLFQISSPLTGLKLNYSKCVVVVPSDALTLQVRAPLGARQVPVDQLSFRTHGKYLG